MSTATTDTPMLISGLSAAAPAAPSLPITSATHALGLSAETGHLPPFSAANFASTEQRAPGWRPVGELMERAGSPPTTLSGSAILSGTAASAGPCGSAAPEPSVSPAQARLIVPSAPGSLTQAESALALGLHVSPPHGLGASPVPGSRLPSAPLKVESADNGQASLFSADGSESSALTPVMHSTSGNVWELLIRTIYLYQAPAVFLMQTFEFLIILHGFQSPRHTSPRRGLWLDPGPQ